MANIEKVTIGKFLKDKRNEKKISIDQICRETNISKRYLEALEADDFALFPGETYLLGFLSTYAEALEVGKKVAINIYRKQMTIEQDAPVEQLLSGGSKKTPPNINFVKLGAILFATLVLVLIILFIVSRTNRSNIKSTHERIIPQTYFYAVNKVTSIENSEFNIGDTINISNITSSNQNPSNMVFDREISINLIKLGISKTLELKVNKKKYHIKEGGVLNIDTDNNNIDDFGFEVFSIKNRKVKFSVTLLKEAAKKKPDIAKLPDEYQNVVLSEVDIIIVDKKERIKLKVIASSSGWLAYSADKNAEEQFRLKKGFEKEITFDDKLELLLGNAGAVQMFVGDKEEKGGSPGEVNKSLFYWKSLGGKYHLVRAMLK